MALGSFATVARWTADEIRARDHSVRRNPGRGWAADKAGSL